MRSSSAATDSGANDPNRSITFNQARNGSDPASRRAALGAADISDNTARLPAWPPNAAPVRASSIAAAGPTMSAQDGALRR
jgi:hypothetical protein